MIIKNAKVFLENQTFEEGEIRVRDGRIEEVRAGKMRGEGFLALPGEEVIDCQGAYAIPGLIDLHFHGCMGDDFCDGTKDAIRRIAEYEASVGVTAIAPATMTLPVEELEAILRTAAEYREEAGKEEAGTGADLVGVNMEGPFISKVKKGAQDERNILPCDVEVARRFLEASKGLVKFIGIAPEESENAIAFIEEMKDQVHISLAHTNAAYDRAKEAFDAGASHAVHLYNAMPAFTLGRPAWWELWRTAPLLWRN